MSIVERLRESLGAGVTPEEVVDARIVANRLRTLMPVVMAMLKVGVPVTPRGLNTVAEALGRATDATMLASGSSTGWVRGAVSRQAGRAFAGIIEREGRLPTEQEVGTVTGALVMVMSEPTREDYAYASDQGAQDVVIAGAVCAMEMRSKLEAAITSAHKGFARNPFRPATPVVEQALRWVYDRGDKALDRVLRDTSPKEMTQHAVARLRESFHRQAAWTLQSALRYQASLSTTAIAHAWQSKTGDDRTRWWREFQQQRPYGLDVDAGFEEAEQVYSATVERACEPMGGADHDVEPEPEPPRLRPGPFPRRP